MPEAEFFSTVGELVAILGFSNFSFASSRSCVRGVENEIVLDNYDSAWRQSYSDNNYAALDPLFSGSVKSLTPFFWGHAEFLEAYDRETKELFEAASDHGVKYGITYPVHTKQSKTCLFSVSRMRPIHLEQEAIKNRFQKLSTLSNYISTYVLAQNTPDVPLSHIVLTDRQRECLLWTLEGKTSWETAKIINRSKATVEFHLQKSIKLLNASNKVHAAIMASKSGLI
ncbi:LuxR family transcriptional regulator [Maritalea sp.]